jgi:hypothetical protein
MSPNVDIDALPKQTATISRGPRAQLKPCRHGDEAQGIGRSGAFVADAQTRSRARQKSPSKKIFPKEIQPKCRMGYSRKTM